MFSRPPFLEGNSLNRMVFVFLAAAFPAFAADDAGTVTGRLGDAAVDAAIWAEQSDYDDYGTGGMGGAVSILTTNIDTGAGMGPMMIFIEGSDLAAGQFDSASVTVIIPETDPPVGLRATLDDGLSVLVTSARVTDGQMHVAGTISGAMSYQNIITKEITNPETPVLDIAFDARLDPLE